MKKLVNLFIIIFFLIAVCIWEEVSINAYLSQLETQIMQLETKVLVAENIDNEDFLVDLRQLEEFWLKKENTFSVILNHKEVEVIGEEIARGMAAVVNNSKEELTSSLIILRFYINNLGNIMGLSWQNLI